jgi:malate dehydrogenase
MFTHTRVNGKSLKQLILENKISEEKLNAIIERTRKGGAEIIKFLEKGSAFYAPAASGVEMAESYIKNLKKTLPCAAYLNGEYGIKNLYAGVPVVIGDQGVEKVIEIKLEDKEKENFEISVKTVKELFEVAVKIDPDLAN